MRRDILVWTSTLLLGLGAGTLSTPASAQTGPGDAGDLAADAGGGQSAPQAPGELARGYEQAYARGNDAYNAGRYDEARAAYIEAIQHHPESAAAYRNLARTYFWQNEFAVATAFYDVYLRLAPGAGDVEQVRSERRLASTRAGGVAWQLPENQRLALAALGDELDEGRAYTAGGGGAWGLYGTLMRMQYAQPELAQVRRRLVRRLVDECEGLMMPAADQLVPALDLDDWKLQRERLRAARKLTDDEALLDVLRRRELIVGAAEALLLGRFDEAARGAANAARENPDMAFLHWLGVAALVRAERYEEALDALDALARRLRDQSPARLDYARVVRAGILQSMRKSDDAAEIYLELLAR